MRIAPLVVFCYCSIAAADGAATRPASAPASRAVFTKKDYEAHIESKVKKLLPGPEFKYVIEEPFIVISDAGDAALKVYRERTVRWAVRLLKKEYFERDPERILDIWLFKDKESYQKHTKEIFNDTPDTPFGYYSSSDGALIMNIATGGGTLVHEMVHPFVEANIPDCPPWLNEGLGSLYEQCGEYDGRIRGRTNWRLAGLQAALRAGTISPFEEFTAQSSLQFYGATRGDNYGQARYLCYYLQEKGLLQKFYQKFLAARDADRTGYKTLCEVLGNPDMKQFFETWKEFSLKLKYN